MANVTRYTPAYINTGDKEEIVFVNEEDGVWVTFTDHEEALRSATTNMQSIPFSFEDIEEDFKLFAKSSYDYSLYSCGAMDMFNFIVAKLNSTRLQ